jgi:hypothetical protein
MSPDHPDQPAPDPDGRDAAVAEPGGDDSDTAAGRDTPEGGDAGERGRRGGMLAELANVIPPPPPPRRTGVFLDADDLREHVGSLLRAVLGGYEVDAFGNFTFTHEGARVFVTVGRGPMGPHVGVFSVTNLDVDLSPPLSQFLLTTNHTLGFGAFSYDPENRAVWLRHTLLGTTLDLPELQTAVAAIATTAAQLDHTIQGQFGGRTFQEAPDEVQRRMEPPEPRQRPPGAGGYL